MKVKIIDRGRGTATLIREGSSVLLVARCSAPEFSTGREDAYHSVFLRTSEARLLLTNFGQELEPGELDFLEYPLYVTEYA